MFDPRIKLFVISWSLSISIQHVEWSISWDVRSLNWKRLDHSMIKYVGWILATLHDLTPNRWFSRNHVSLLWFKSRLLIYERYIPIEPFSFVCVFFWNLTDFQTLISLNGVTLQTGTIAAATKFVSTLDGGKTMSMFRVKEPGTSKGSESRGNESWLSNFLDLSVSHTLLSSPHVFLCISWKIQHGSKGLYFLQSRSLLPFASHLGV